MHKKGKRKKGFSSSRFGEFFGGRLIYIHERGRKNEFFGGFFDGQGQRERLSREEEGSMEKTSGKNLRIQKPVEIFSPKGSVSRYVYCRPLLDSDYPFDV